MIVHISSLAFSGIDIIEVDVQVQITSGIPAFTIVGLADKTIAESKERVRAALSSIGLAMPAKKILINLAPADLLKEGSHFDLAIACSILTNMGVLPVNEINEYLILGELSLDGSIVPVSGALPAAVGANARGLGLICAEANGSEAAWSGNNKILAPGNLIELINHFKGIQTLSPPLLPKYSAPKSSVDFKDICGHKSAKRVIEIAATGSHNLLMSGPPGAGKSMLAQRIPTVLPQMTSEEILECTTVASIAGELQDKNLIAIRPFRAPHHSCSVAAMVGGGIGKRVKPGEISLAHNGVLFLDELPEFPQNVIDSLRQPIETGQILISRANSHIKYPANFQLIAAMNPCKCGYLQDEIKACSKAPKCGKDYRNKISGPILDRFDLHIEVGNSLNYQYQTRGDAKDEEHSADIAQRVASARNIQTKRYLGCGIKTNNKLEGSLLIDFAMPGDEGKNLLNDAATKFKLSMRSYNKILKVARTIADLDASKYVYKIHIAEALSYRQMSYDF